MSYPESIYDTVEKFLVLERNKLAEDKKILDFVLNQLDEKQQNFDYVEAGSQKTNANILINFEDDEQLNFKGNNSTDCVKQFEENRRKLPMRKELCFSNKLNKLKDYNCQTEKERLAYLFENSPYVFGRRCKPSKYKRNGVENHDKSRENKENFFPNYDCSKQNFSCSTPAAGKLHQKDEKSRVMVRYGEFSPLNPAFRGSDKPLLGLGEYEERRKIFLEKKKREYHQYLDNAKNNKLSNMYQKTNSEKSETTHQNDISSLKKLKNGTSPESLSFHEVVSLPGDLNEVSTFTKWQQDTYRKELDDQIEEKRRIHQQQKEKEEKECKNFELQDIMQRRNLTRSIEEEFRRRMNSCSMTDKHIYNGMNEIQVPQTNSSVPRKVDRNVFSESDSRVTSRIRSPILKHTTETCAVDDIESYQKMQKELYKMDLSKQIEEKRKMEEQRKLKELEEEKRVDARIQKEEEKLRLEYEKEQAEREYRASQKVQLEERLQENLRRIQQENEKKKNSFKTKPVPKLISKPSNIYPTNHRFNDKNSTKNVSFAPQTFVHTIYNENEYKKRNSSFSKKIDNSYKVPEKTETDGEYDAVIIDAPYLLAVNDIVNHSQPANCHTDLRFEENRSPSPILPALRTHNLLKAIPKLDDPATSCLIPLGVSMSKEAKDQYMKSSKISNLSEIRRKLMQKQSNLRSE